jgi:hypothetical protein
MSNARCRAQPARADRSCRDRQPLSCRRRGRAQYGRGLCSAVALALWEASHCHREGAPGAVCSPLRCKWQAPGLARSL